MNHIQITETRESNAYNVIDCIVEVKTYTTDWFVTKDHIENIIKPNLNKYYEFILFILETCIPITKEEKEIKKELEDLIKNYVDIVNDNNIEEDGDFK